MAIQHDAIDTVEDIFLKMFVRLDRVANRHVASATGATTRGEYIHGPIVGGGRRAEPTGMTDGGTPFFGFGRGGFLGRIVLGVGGLFLLLVGGELVLPFELEFQLGLFQVLSEFFVLFDELGDGFSLGVDRAVKITEELILLASRVNECSQRRAAKMWAMADVWAAMFVVGIKAELHRHPFQN